MRPSGGRCARCHAIASTSSVQPHAAGVVEVLGEAEAALREVLRPDADADAGRAGAGRRARRRGGRRLAAVRWTRARSAGRAALRARRPAAARGRRRRGSGAPPQRREDPVRLGDGLEVARELPLRAADGARAVGMGLHRPPPVGRLERLAPGGRPGRERRPVQHPAGALDLVEGDLLRLEHPAAPLRYRPLPCVARASPAGQFSAAPRRSAGPPRAPRHGPRSGPAGAPRRSTSSDRRTPPAAAQRRPDLGRGSANVR